MPGGQSSDVAIERKRLGHAAEQMEANNAGRFRVARNMLAREQRLDLRSKAECPAVVCCVERFDAVGVACKEDAAPHLVPDCECEHATEPMHHLGAVARVEVQERLRVGGRAEACTLGFELHTQLRIIVNLDIEHNDGAAALSCHRLGSAVGKIDDRKASMPQAAMPVPTPPGA